MRGGALPVLAWGCILTLLYAANWIWSGKPIEAIVTGFALLLVFVAAALLAAANRQAIRRGAPPDEPARAEGIPDFSFGALGAAIAVAFVALGLAFGHFLIYFGAGLFVLSLARLAIELRAARATVRRYRLDPLPPPPDARTGEGAAAQEPRG